MINLKKAKMLAMHLAREAGHVLIDNVQHSKITNMKDKRDFCTNMDIKIEKMVIKGIREFYPDHSIHSEEVGDIEKKSDYLWVIDPIDGTKQFFKNIPLFAVCIALEYKGELVMGVVFNPSTHHLYHAYKGGGAYLNNKKIKVSNTNRIDHAFVYLDISRLHHLPKKETQDGLKRLNKFVTDAYRIRALGIGSLGMCYMAQGAYDVYFDLTGSTKYVDIAASTVIVQEAGGFVMDLFGKPIGRHTKHLFAVNKKLKKKIMNFILKV
jgi:myo-inositol-1(or 4)-monophosphatase